MTERPPGPPALSDQLAVITLPMPITIQAEPRFPALQPRGKKPDTGSPRVPERRWTTEEESKLLVVFWNEVTAREVAMTV